MIVKNFLIEQKFQFDCFREILSFFLFQFIQSVEMQIETIRKILFG